MERDKKPLKILYGVETLGGGVLRHIASLVDGLNPAYFSIHLITSPPTDSNILDKIRLMEKKGTIFNFVPMARGINVVRDCKALISIIKYVKHYDIDIIHAHSSKAGAIFRIAALICRKPSVYTPHCYYFVANKGMKKYFYKKTEQLLSRITHKIILSNNEMVLVRSENFKIGDKYVVINNAIQKEKYKYYNRIEVVNKLNIPASAIIICGVGRLAIQKDWPTFILAAARVLEKIQRNVFFLIAGAGEEYNELQNLLQQTGHFERIKLLGNMQDISKIYSCADIFVSTSLWEGLPYSYLEAVHFNLPMILSRTAFMDSIIDPATCSFFTPGDYGELSYIITKAISNIDKSIPSQLRVNSCLDKFLYEHHMIYSYLYKKGSGKSG